VAFDVFHHSINLCLLLILVAALAKTLGGCSTSFDLPWTIASASTTMYAFTNYNSKDFAFSP